MLTSISVRPKCGEGLCEERHIRTQGTEVSRTGYVQTEQHPEAERECIGTGQPGNAGCADRSGICTRQSECRAGRCVGAGQGEERLQTGQGAIRSLSV